LRTYTDAQGDMVTAFFAPPTKPSARVVQEQSRVNCG